MCGIVGVIMKPRNGFIKQTEDAFYQLLFANTVRGDDSTGVIAIETDTSFHIMKEAVEATWFIPQFQYSPVGKEMWTKGKALIGHNRKGTVGKVKDDTAHPFVIGGEFAMVHNGTLIGHKKLADTEVDSEALAIVLAKAFMEKDAKEAVEKQLADVHGAYALAMYDQRHDVVRLLRNKERPLALVETSNAWFYASEGLMLHWILARNGYTSKELETLRSIPEDTLLTFDLAANTLVEEKLSVKKHTPHTTNTPTVVYGGLKTSKSSPKPTVIASLSKNEFKRIRRKLIGTVIEWWADDHIETNFPKEYTEGETLFNLMGTCDEIDEDHIIHTQVDVSELHIKPSNLDDRLWSGRVDNMVYSTKTGMMSVYLINAKPLPISVKKVKKDTTPLVIDAAYIQRKLDEKEKTLTLVH